MSPFQDEDDDDFEVVPQTQDDGDVDMWDVEGEDEDEIKQEKIRSMFLRRHCKNPYSSASQNTA